MSNYNLNVQNGKIEYLMKSGKDVVKAETTEQNAEWIIKNKGVKNESIEGFPDYPIFAGEFYFAGTWTPSIFDEEKKPKRRKNALGE